MQNNKTVKTSLITIFTLFTPQETFYFFTWPKTKNILAKGLLIILLESNSLLPLKQFSLLSHTDIYYSPSLGDTFKREKYL